MSTGSAPSCGAASRTGTTDPDGGDAFIGQVVLNGIDNRPKVGLFEGGGIHYVDPDFVVASRDRPIGSGQGSPTAPLVPQGGGIEPRPRSVKWLVYLRKAEADQSVWVTQARGLGPPSISSKRRRTWRDGLQMTTRSPVT